MEQEDIQKGIGEEEVSQAIPQEEAVVSPKTYSEEDLKAARLAQARADVELSKAQAELNKIKADYEDAVADLKDLQEELTRKDEETFGDDVEGKSAAKVRREARMMKKELEKKERQIARREEEFKQIEEKQKQAEMAQVKAKAIDEISRRYGVKPKLLEYATSYEEAETLAKLIQEETGSGTTPRPTFDTGISNTGSRRSFTREQIAKMSLDEYTKYHSDIVKAQREGRIK